VLQLTTKAIFHALAQSDMLKRLASHYGMANRDSFARRFIAGEHIEDAIAAARVLQSKGMLLTLDYLGESVSTTEEADAATREYLRVLDAVSTSGIERNVSIKLTQLGLDVDRATCVDNMRRILEPAIRQGFFVRIDMEDSHHADLTLDIFETLWRHDYRNIGVVLQAYLRRTDVDLRRIVELGARIRLVKGAYQEPKGVAFQDKAEIDAEFVRLMKVLLDSGNYPAIATHDAAMIAATKAYAGQRGVPPDRFEFQMLYGIRRDVQAALVAGGYRMRVYVPFGQQWFPYFMRRLGERPANVAFVLRSLLREKQTT
jgi:proline dehydrogenase